MRDNALASALRRAGHDVTLIPLYTPLRTDTDAASIPEVYFGGVNVYLQHATRLFRHTPRVLDAIFDRPWLLNAAGNLGAQTPPQKLADLTLDVLQAEDGHATKELDRLLHFLKNDVRPEVISLPNLMFIGMARVFRRELRLPVICELTGEDIFLDAMGTADRLRIQQLIRARAGDVTRFVATSGYYASRMAEYLEIARQRIDVVHTGLSREYLARPSLPRPTDRPPTVGYLARICPEKGLSRLIDAFIILRGRADMRDVRLRIGGYLGAKDRQWFHDLENRVAKAGMAHAVEYVGEVDRERKLDLLDSIDVLSVPTIYPESKGIYVLEAMASGVPVVQPAHGSFPELMEMTGGGVLVPPGDAEALADALAELLRDPARRAELGRAGRAAVESRFTDDQMTANIIKIFDAAMDQNHQPTSRRGILEIEAIWKQYPTPAEPLVVLRGVSFSLEPGESMAIVGPSGSGKSTLLNILGTLDHPTRGTVRLSGVDPFKLRSSELASFRSRKLGFVFQDHHLLPQCSALENVLVARLAVGRAGDDDASHAAELLQLVGLADRARHLPSELSGGERQRVAIARALMNGPQLLLCDEPTGNLDQKTSHAIAQLLLELADKMKAILITVTHSASVAAMFASQMRMSDGLLMEAPAEVPAVPLIHHS
jgi:ABC-type lipoprotein export system ATPase subunit/glycosyltransferase involved in cell wall biosynthesis